MILSKCLMVSMFCLIVSVNTVASENASLVEKELIDKELIDKELVEKERVDKEFAGTGFAKRGLTSKRLDAPQFLPVDEAFVLTASRQGNAVQLHWLVKPGYYLYRDRLSFEGSISSPDVPKGKLKFDEIFGEVEVYYEELLINLHVSSSYNQNSDIIRVGYQGCADAGLCYPAQKREFLLKNL